MQDGRKAVWNTPYVSVSFFPSLKQKDETKRLKLNGLFPSETRVIQIKLPVMDFKH